MISASIEGKSLREDQEKALVANILEDVRAYKEEYDSLLKAGYALANYTPKVKLLDISGIKVEEGQVAVSFQPVEFAKDEDIRRLLLFLIETNLRPF